MTNNNRYSNNRSNNGRNDNCRNGGCRNDGYRNESRRNDNCRNDGCRNDNNDDKNCRATMNKLRAVDFALTETVLYLDAYPDSEEAMKLYCKLVGERNQLIDAYESKCGPLTMYGNNGSIWNWTEGPWPWEAEAN